ncbi:MAG: YciI family protein [Solirubrobacteraceae bacterium]
MTAAGTVSRGGSWPVSAATTVRVRKGEVMVADGPFAETKEFVAGFDVLECADLDEPIALVARNPAARFDTIELRPVVEE